MNIFPLVHKAELELGELELGRIRSCAPSTNIEVKLFLA